MRQLHRAQMRLEEAEHRLRLCDLPELAVIVEMRLVAPHAQDDLQRLARHLPVHAAHAVDMEHRPVARQPARRDAKIEPPLG